MKKLSALIFSAFTLLILFTAFTRISFASVSDYTLANKTFVTLDGGRVEWSNDGQWIYSDRREADGFWDVYKMRPDGSQQQCLTCNHPGLPNLHQGQPAEHPSGNYIVFQAEDPNHVFPTSHGPAEPGSGVWSNLWILDMRDNSVYQLNQVPVGLFNSGGSLHAHFSHDGHKIAWGDREGGADVLGNWRVAVADFVEYPTPHVENIVYYDPGENTTHWLEMSSWSEDDTALYVSCNCMNGQDEVNMDTVRIDLATSAWTRLTNTGGVNGEPGEWDEFSHVNPAYGDARLRMSSNSYGTQTDSPDLPTMLGWLQTEYWLSNVDRSDPVRLTYFNEPSHPDYVPGGFISSDLSWSPDGKRAVGFVWVKTATPPEQIMVMDFNRTETPTASSLNETVEHDESVVLTLNSSDPAVCEQAFSVFSQPDFGTLTNVIDLPCVPGTPNTDSVQVTFTPNGTFLGTERFAFRTNNGTTDSNIAWVTISVVDTNPVAVDDAVSVAMDTPIIISVLSNDTDPNNLPLFVSGVTQPAHGSAVVNPDYTITYTPSAGYFGPDEFEYTVENTNGGSDTGLVSITVYENQAPETVMYFTVEGSGTLGGVSYTNEDILTLDDSGAFGLYFDGSDVGIGSFTLDAFSRIDEDEILMSFAEAGTIPGISGTTDDSDLVKFTASSLGDVTAGTFSFYFDGSDVSLTQNGEDVDGVELLSDGKILISTTDSASVTGVSAADEDFMRFSPTSLGLTTAGTWEMYFDGSDVGLSTNNSEDVDGFGVDSNGDIYLSTLGSFSVTGVSGAGEDVFVFVPSSLGLNTSGTYNLPLFFDGSVFGLTTNLSAFDLP